MYIVLYYKNRHLLPSTKHATFEEAKSALDAFMDQNKSDPLASKSRILKAVD